MVPPMMMVALLVKLMAAMKKRVMLMTLETTMGAVVEVVDWHRREAESRLAGIVWDRGDMG